MIIDGNFRLTGLKQNDITSDITDIIDNAEKFIFICGYSFTNHKNPKSILNKVINSPVTSKHCVLPINLYKGKDVNRLKAIELVKEGISVSIENKNHSKWIMSENEIYYGSANFSMDSLERKIEVASFRRFHDNDKLLKEFRDFVKDSMNNMLQKSDRRAIHGVITKNDNLIKSTRKMINKLNPDIEKVMKTVDSINIVRSYIYEVLENCFWYLNDDDYYRLTKTATWLDDIIQRLHYKGMELLMSDENSKNFKLNVYHYNKDCNKFIDNVYELSKLSSDFLQSEKKVPYFSKNNRKLGRHNLATINNHYKF